MAEPLSVRIMRLIPQAMHILTMSHYTSGPRDPAKPFCCRCQVGVSPILNDGGEALHEANLRVAFGKVPNAQRLFEGCSHGTIPRVDLGGEPHRDWHAVVGRAWASTAGAGRAGRGLGALRASVACPPTLGTVGGSSRPPR